jgi:hypothetical protein
MLETASYEYVCFPERVAKALEVLPAHNFFVEVIGFCYRLLKSAQRSRSEAGQRLSIADCLQSRLLHLDVRHLPTTYIDSGPDVKCGIRR